MTCVPLDNSVLIRSFRFAAVLVVLVAAAWGQTNSQASQSWKAVEDAVGWPAQVQPDGVARFTMPRSNLQATVNGIPMTAGFALTSWAAFQRHGGSAMATGDLVLLQTEVPAVMSAILQGGMQVTGLHNHLLNTIPVLMYMHIHGSGDAVEMAKTIHHAIALTSTPEPGTPTQPPSQQYDLDTQQISQILGAQGKANNGILQFSIPRPEKIMENGVEIPPTMGVASAINFQPTGEGRASITGDLAVITSEVTPVLQALRQNGIVVTAIHNHMLSETPRLTFVHFWANGPATMMARQLRPALDKMGHR